MHSCQSVCSVLYNVTCLPLVVLMLAAAFQVQLIDTPVLKIVRKRYNAHFLDQVKFARSKTITQRDYKQI